MRNVRFYAIKGAAIISAVAMIGGCSGGQKRVIDGPWGGGECLEKPIEMVLVDQSFFESRHHIRLGPGAAESPHIHEYHDLVLKVVSGSARAHSAGAVLLAKSGTEIVIPSGTIHWAENISADDPTEAVAIFSPPFDGKDTVPAK